MMSGSESSGETVTSASTDERDDFDLVALGEGATVVALLGNDVLVALDRYLGGRHLYRLQETGDGTPLGNLEITAVDHDFHGEKVLQRDRNVSRTRTC